MGSLSMRQIIDLAESLMENSEIKAQKLTQKYRGRKIRVTYGSNKGIIGEIEYFFVDDEDDDDSGWIEHRILVAYKIVGGKTSSPNDVVDIGRQKWAYSDQIEILP